jgi:alkylation response protein AidB-like acyl-CoA dehydrogenase
MQTQLPRFATLRHPRHVLSARNYEPPLDDIRFVLDEITSLDDVASLPCFEHADSESVEEALAECGRFVRNVIAPLNAIGDRKHSRRRDDGSVVTPDGFRAAYRQYVAAGWAGVGLPVEYGGGGFPCLALVALEELVAAGNLAFSLCPILTQGAVDLLVAHASEAQKATWLPKMVTGEWAGTMCLTEPDAGSDVGAVRTSAMPTADGVWRITGQKIFITYGEHDLADNIVHLVLARIPDAPPGTKGISCFIVPKLKVSGDGALIERNAVSCLSIEDKLGIHASPTCVLAFDDAVGYLVGEPNEGMRCMFTMMNKARLSVGVHGLAVAERAYQQAIAYASERRQGRVLGSHNAGASPIIEHPDVRRMLFTIKASVEALRALIYLVAESIDLSEHHHDDAVRAERRELVELLTPVAKAWGTDLGVELTSLALQVHGGMGYVEETGAAQLLRDARIGPIYEGTNGIQAIDLVTRKLPIRDGGAVRHFLCRLDAIDGELGAVGEEVDGIRADVLDALETLRAATDWMLATRPVEPVVALAAATPYLQLFGLVTGGWLMACQAAAASRRLAAGEGPRDFLRSKVVTARFYCEQLLPQSAGLLAAVTASPHEWLALESDQL